MAHINVAHRRTHNLLLISKLLTQRDHVSPFTMVMDSLEQTAGPLLREYIRRAQTFQTYTVFLGFETTRPPRGVDHFIRCYDRTPSQISQAVGAAVESVDAKRVRVLVLVDSLYQLCHLSVAGPGFDLTTHVSLWLTPPRSNPQLQLSVVAVYHGDVPLPVASVGRTYEPAPLDLLLYLATTVIRVHSIPTLLAAKAAGERSRAAPAYGLAEEKEGVVIGLKPDASSTGTQMSSASRGVGVGVGVALELEHRRKSGRGVVEWFFLPASPDAHVPVPPPAFKETVTLLDDHPLFRKSRDDGSPVSGQDLAGLTFELGLTERQRLERDGVVLPYYDAQQIDGGVAGPGAGGRILYDMGEEDDFDEEEDEM